MKRKAKKSIVSKPARKAKAARIPRESRLVLRLALTGFAKECYECMAESDGLPPTQHLKRRMMDDIVCFLGTSDDIDMDDPTSRRLAKTISPGDEVPRFGREREQEAEQLMLPLGETRETRHLKLRPLGEVIDEALAELNGGKENGTFEPELIADRAVRAVCEMIVRDGGVTFPLHVEHQQ